LKSPKGSTIAPHHALSSFGKLSMSSALGSGFLMFRPMLEELCNIEQFCNKSIIISKVLKLGQWGHTFGTFRKCSMSIIIWRSFSKF
jgi:hypothetical protein